MPQGRVILKRICQSKKLAALSSDGARLLYTWLLPNVDVNGCYSGDAQEVKGTIFTQLKKSASTIEKYLLDLENKGLIILYDNNGQSFLQIPDFVDRQPSINPDREAKPTILPPTPDQLQTSSSKGPLKVKESKVKESKTQAKRKSGYSPEFESFWKKYPARWDPANDRKCKVGKHDAFLIWETLTAAEQELSLYAASKMRPGKAIKDAHRWLKHRGFDDFEKPVAKPVQQPRNIKLPADEKPVKRHITVPRMKTVVKVSRQELMQKTQKQLKDLRAKP